MFGTSIEFSGLPAELQYAAIAGAIIGGAIYAYLKGKQAGVTTAPDPARPLDDAQRRVVELAAELADERVRRDLTEVVEKARDALHFRMDQLAETFRDDARDREKHNDAAHGAIYDRINGLDRRVQDHNGEIAMLKARRTTR